MSSSSSSTAPTDAPAARRGAWIPWLFAAFFLVVCAVNGTMIWAATTSWTGLETDSPYDKGLTYNRNLEAARRQAALGWQPRFEARLAGADQAAVRITLTDAAGQPLDGAQVTAHFERLGEEAVDFALPLRPGASGTYEAEAPLARLGAWRVHLTIERGADSFVRDEQVVLR